MLDHGGAVADEITLAPIGDGREWQRSSAAGRKRYHRDPQRGTPLRVATVSARAQAAERLVTTAFGEADAVILRAVCGGLLIWQARRTKESTHKVTKENDHGRKTAQR